MSVAFGIFLFGLLLSALFSGAETAFYRIPPTRLKLDALSGSRTAQIILWFANRTSLFIATVLTGNNLANYCVSFGAVLFLQKYFGYSNLLLELGAAVLLTPILFVYGEMFPKNVSLLAPYRFLRRFMPLLVFFTVVFLPVTLLLWGFNRCIAFFSGRSRQFIRLNLARSELANVLEEGRETGVLLPVQRRLAASICDGAVSPVGPLAIPPNHFPVLVATLSPAAAWQHLLQFAKKSGKDEFCGIPVCDETGEYSGYARVAELRLATAHHSDFIVDSDTDTDTVTNTITVHPLLEFSPTHSTMAAMCLFQSTGENFGRIRTANGMTVGFLSEKQLRDVLCQEQKTVTGHNPVGIV